MTRPENVSPPPNCSAYTLDDGTMMKKEIWSSGIIQHKNHRAGRKCGMTCMSTFVVSTTIRELVFGSLNSGFSSSPTANSSGSVICGFPKLEFGRDAGCNGSSTTSTSTFDILSLSVLTQLHGGRLLVEFKMTKRRGRGVGVGRESPPAVRTVRCGNESHEVVRRSRGLGDLEVHGGSRPGLQAAPRPVTPRLFRRQPSAQCWTINDLNRINKSSIIVSR